MLEVPQLTHVVAAAVQAVRPLLRAEDERKIARALGLFEAGVDTGELDRRIAVERPAADDADHVRVRADRACEGGASTSSCPRATTTASCAPPTSSLRRGVVALTILGDPDQVQARAAALGADLDGAEIVDPLGSPLREEYAARYYELRKHKGMTEELASTPWPTRATSAR